MTNVHAPKAAAERAAQHADLRRRLPAPAMRRAIRTGAGLSLRHIAEAIGGVSPQAVGLWEAGERTPSERLLPAYVAVLERLSAESRVAS